jgi:hypothetical protein
MKRSLLRLLALSSIAACADELPEQETTEAPPLRAETCGEYDRAAIWQPEKGATWDWQLSGSVDTSVAVDIYDVDLFDSSAQLISRLHAQGRKVVCYVNVGAWEEWRPDASKFPKEILGKTWSATKYTNERWLDIRRIDLLTPLLGARFDMAKQKGCDAIEPDNIDGYDDAGRGEADRTGFDLTSEDQLRFNRYLACEAHTRGMAIGLKNDTGQADQLSADFDFVVSEQCFDYNECKRFTPFLAKNKAVLVAEYREDLGASAEAKFDGFCKQAEQLGISAILKNNALDRWRRACAHDQPSAPATPAAPASPAAPEAPTPAASPTQAAAPADAARPTTGRRSGRSRQPTPPAQPAEAAPSGG